MKNTFRTKDWLAFSRNMRKCFNLLQLEGMKKFILKYHKDKEQDSAELLALYLEREKELSPETAEEEILNIYHKKLEAK